MIIIKNIIRKLCIFLVASMHVMIAPFIRFENEKFSFEDPRLQGFSLELYDGLVSDETYDILTQSSYSFDEFCTISNQLLVLHELPSFSGIILKVQNSDMYSYSLPPDVFNQMLESGTLEAFFPNGPGTQLTLAELRLLSLVMERLGGTVGVNSRGNFESEKIEREFLQGTGGFAKEPDGTIPNVRRSIDVFTRNFLIKKTLPVRMLDTLD